MVVELRPFGQNMGLLAAAQLAGQLRVQAAQTTGNAIAGIGAGIATGIENRRTRARQAQSRQDMLDERALIEADKNRQFGLTKLHALLQFKDGIDAQLADIARTAVAAGEDPNAALQSPDAMRLQQSSKDADMSSRSLLGQLSEIVGRGGGAAAKPP